MCRASNRGKTVYKDTHGVVRSVCSPTNRSWSYPPARGCILVLSTHHISIPLLFLRLQFKEVVKHQGIDYLIEKQKYIPFSPVFKSLQTYFIIRVQCS